MIRQLSCEFRGMLFLFRLRASLARRKGTISHVVEIRSWSCGERERRREARSLVYYRRCSGYCLFVSACRNLLNTLTCVAFTNDEQSTINYSRLGRAQILAPCRRWRTLFEHVSPNRVVRFQTTLSDYMPDCLYNGSVKSYRLTVSL